MPSDTPGPPVERRGDKRFAGGSFPLLAPAEATIVDCGPRGVGIETRTYLAVGSLTSVNVFVPAGEMVLLGRVCWARMVASRRRSGGDSEAVYRVGLAFVDGQSFESWDRLLARLISPRHHAGGAARPRRKVVKWRRPLPRP